MKTHKVQLLPQVFEDRLVKAMTKKVLINRQGVGTFEVLSHPYEDRNQFYVNVIDMYNRKKYSIRLEDIDLFDTLGTLPPSFTNFSKL